ncbi:MAG: hypothetical protein KDC88_04570 [Ignavibacteriae bacterium]|nr:hypothetical protein [Ignavibacteriota bacterium]MCB9208864.1 hypothetical protein [Ignavibacteriales bacterium]MCB9218218.1 hypothetical protein [Ignavibacteriales bacterium]MCB9260719.1 hypothetical protein [Ignavibacteriales bacterium]
MKKLMLISAIFFGIFISSASAHSKYYLDIDVNYFYGSLEPYGEWIEIGYDDYVWRPYKSDYNWRPYSDGRWEWTRNGWYWVSYEPFGWATYHYGRWYFDDYYGWVWMPDNVWAPAWVEWRYNDAYIGWAPLPPYARFNNRHGIYFSINWNSGHVYWNFVKYNHFISYDIRHHCVDRHYVKNIYTKTKYRTNYFDDNNRIVNGGISRRFIEDKVGRKLTTREISRTNNFDDFNSKDVRKRNSIIEYVPSEKAVKSSSFDKRKVVKGSSLKSLDSDKIVINRRDSNKDSGREISKGIDNSNNKRDVLNGAERKPERSTSSYEKNNRTIEKRKSDEKIKSERNLPKSEINKSNEKTNKRDLSTNEISKSSSKKSKPEISKRSSNENKREVKTSPKKSTSSRTKSKTEKTVKDKSRN